MLNKLWKALSIGIVALLVTSSAVLAVTYQSTIQINETLGTPWDNLPIIVDINNTYLANNGYIDSTGLDTRVTSIGGTKLNHLLANDKTLFAIDIEANSITKVLYTFGNDMLDSFPIITGIGGYVTVADVDPDLELGDVFQFMLYNICLDTTAGAGKFIIYKEDAIDFSVDAVTDGTITFTVVGGASVSASIPSATYNSIEVMSDGTDLYLYINGTFKDSDTWTITVPDTGTPWIFFEGSTVKYIESLELIK